MSIDDIFTPNEEEVVEALSATNDMLDDLVEIQKFIDEMKATSKSTKKLEIITKYKDNQSVLKAFTYAMHPYKKFFITPKNCVKQNHLCVSSYNNLWTLLDALVNRDITGHEAIASTNGFIEMYPEYEDIIFSIINKNLKIRASYKMVNKVIPDFIPKFELALGYPYEPKRVEGWLDTKPDTEDQWLGSRKLDGVRCLTIFNHKTKEITCHSKEGNVFHTLSKIKDDILNLNLTKTTIFDGEVCIIDENGLENFKAIMKEINKKDHTIEDPRYILFDSLTLEEFESEVSDRIFTERIKQMKDEVLGGNSIRGRLKLLEQVVIQNDEHIAQMITDAETSGFEGLILRRNTTYKGKRSYDLLKIKKFYDAEYEIVSIESETQRVLVNGLEVEELMLARANIKHKGSIVGVGSGWTQEQRRNFHHNPHFLIGRKITVQYFEETQDSKTLEYSLRFPTLKQLWEFERDV